MLTLALLWRWREPIQDDGVVTFSPPHLVCFSAGIAAYVVVIFTWHNVSAQLPTRMGGQTVFMDKLCISQTDMKKKRAWDQVHRGHTEAIQAHARRLGQKLLFPSMVHIRNERLRARHAARFR